MKRIPLVGTAGALLVALVVPAAPASAAVPAPDPRAESTATYAEVGTPDAADVKAALGWPAEHPMTVTNEPNPTTDVVHRRTEGNPWIGEKVSDFTALVDTAPFDESALVPRTLTTGIRQTSAVRDRDFARLVSRLEASPASRTTIVASSATSITYVDRGRDLGFDPPLAIAVTKAGPNALTTAVCRAGDGSTPTAAQATACSEPLAELLRERYVAGWPAISAHWPDPTRPLVLPAKSRMKDRLLTARQIYRISGTAGRLPLFDGYEPQRWRVHAFVLVKIDGARRSHARIDLLRTGDVPAARTELHHLYRASAVRADARSFTSYGLGRATTWRRVGTGLIRTRCWRATTGSKAEAIRCSRRLSEAQVDKAGHLFKR